MRTFSANIMVILTILIFHSSQVHSQVLQDKTILNWTIQNSDKIFEGRIVSSESFWSKDKETIITKNQVAVSKHFKGSNISNIEIYTLGGTIGDMTQYWTHNPSFEIGQEGMFFGQTVYDPMFSDTPLLIPTGEHGFVEYGKSYMENGYPNATRMAYSDIYGQLYETLTNDYRLEPIIISTNSIENYLIDNGLGLSFISSSDVLIEFTFDNIVFNGVDIVEFDIMAKSNQAGIKFSASDVYLTYNTQAFGSNAVQNEKIEATKETVIQDSIYTLSLFDEEPDLVKLVINSTGFIPGQLYPLSITAEKFLHVKLDVESIYELAQISFDGSLMTNESYFYDENTGQVIGFDKVAVDDPFYSFLTANVTSFFPNPIRAGIGDTLFIEGTGFGTTKGDILFPNADNGGSGTMTANDFDVVWTDTLIKVKVPSVEFTNSNGSRNPAGSGDVILILANNIGRDTLFGLDIEYASRNFRIGSGEAIRTYLSDDPEGDGAEDGVLVLRPTQSVVDSNNMAVTIIEEAMCNWTSTTGIQWDLGAVIPLGPLPDSTNVINFTNSPLIAGGITATTRVTLSTCSDFSNLPPSPLSYMQEFDIFLRPDLINLPMPINNWFFSLAGNPGVNELDFYSVILHELGHVHGLRHANPDSRLMYYELQSGQTKRNITTQDSDGGSEMLASSQNILNPNDTDCFLAVTTGSSCLTSVLELYQAETIEIFPNPTSSSFTIKLTDAEAGNIELLLFNSVGQQVKVINIGSIPSGDVQFNVDMSDLPSGIYSILFDQNKTYYVGRITKI